MQILCQIEEFTKIVQCLDFLIFTVSSLIFTVSIGYGMLY